MCGDIKTDVMGTHGSGWQATFGVGPSLYDGARDATSKMVELVHEERGLSREDAYILCSVAADLKINELVDAPNRIVGCFLPDGVFSSS